MPTKRKKIPAQFFFDYYEDAFWGLAFDDDWVSVVKKSEFAFPIQASKRKRNEKKYLKRLRMKRMLNQDGFNSNKVVFLFNNYFTSFQSK